MKCGLFIAAIFGVVVVTLARPPDDCPLMKLLKPSIEACMEKLSEENMKLLEEDHDADNEEIRCFQACIITKAGFMEGAKMDIPKMEQMMAESDKPEMARHILDDVKACQPEAEVSDNECEVAGAYAKCMRAKMPPKH